MKRFFKVDNILFNLEHVNMVVKDSRGEVHITASNGHHILSSSSDDAIRFYNFMESRAVTSSNNYCNY